MPITIRMAVVFPAPLGPRNPKTRPGSTVNDRPSRATVRPYRRRNPASLSGPDRTRPGGQPPARSAASETDTTYPVRGSADGIESARDMSAASPAIRRARPR